MTVVDPILPVSFSGPKMPFIVGIRNGRIFALSRIAPCIIVPDYYR